MFTACVIPVTFAVTAREAGTDFILADLHGCPASGLPSIQLADCCYLFSQRTRTPACWPLIEGQDVCILGLNGWWLT